MIAELADALGTDPNYLILGEQDQSPTPYAAEMTSLFNRITDPKTQQVLYIQIKALVENPCL